MHQTELFGYLGALLTLATFSMKTMLRLRMVGIVANVAFITYGAIGHVYPVLLLHLTLLPLNAWRLRQLFGLTRAIDAASAGAVSLAWLKPFSRQRAVPAGEVLFRSGDAADDLLFVLSGRFRAVEANTVLASGDVFGELGLVAKDQRRTQTVVCDEAGALLQISYAEVKQMYFQNPQFGFFFLNLVADRLQQDARLLAQSRAVTGDSAATTAPRGLIDPTPAR